MNLVNIKGNKRYPEIIEPIFTSKAFRFIWIGNSLSTFGTAITNIILPLLVYNLTRSPMEMGVIMTAYMLPEVLILPISGIIVDKFNRAKIMRLADITRFISSMCVMFLGLTNHLSINILIIIMMIMGLMSGVFQPAFSAMRATVFLPTIRNSANALNQITVELLNLLGPSVGGLIVSFMSAPIGFGIDGVTYLISFICLLFLTNEGTVKKQSLQKTSFLKECLSGIYIVQRNTWLWVTIVFFSFVNIAISGVVTVLIPWLIKVHEHLPAYTFGIIMSGSAIGSIGASFIFGMRKKWHFRGLIAYGGVALAGFSLILISFAHYSGLLILLMSLEGAGFMLFGLIWETSLQELVSQDEFGRVASIDMLGSFALLPFGYLLTGWLANSIGGITTIFILSSIVVIATLFIILIPEIRKFD
ncbi:MFS transporter [Sporolactobacillus sp. KGMB 08714]|uniref:MFS transporter n=1 Tax=Sporolactobacillus sp. KGMB 08714 TaxID=3064704 RepID=UPI002FBEF807